MSIFSRFSLLLLSALLLGLPARAETTAAAKPETVADDAGHFVATFPGAVRRSSQVIDTEVGKITQSLVFHDGGSVVFMISFNDYPAGSISRSGGSEKACDNASDGVIKSLKGKLRTASSCKSGDIIGREVIFDDASNVDRARFFIIGDRLYQLLYIGPAGDTDSHVQAFFDSFRLTR